MELIVFVLLVGALLGWAMGSAATRYGRAGRDVVSAKSTWEKAVHTRNFERWKTVRIFAVIGGGVVVAVWLAIHSSPPGV
jgi:hypothetical protein